MISDNALLGYHQFDLCTVKRNMLRKIA